MIFCHDKGKLLTIVDPSERHFQSKILPFKSLYSQKKFASEQMPFFENTEILRRDVQVLDHMLTMGVVKTRNAGISRNMAEYHGIWRNITEYGGITRNITTFSRNIPEHHNIFRW